MGGSQGRELGCRDRRRADQSRRARRHDQDRPARLAVRQRSSSTAAQGHAAYPHLADNPVRGLMTLVDALLHPSSTTAPRISSRPIWRSPRSMSAIRPPMSFRQRRPPPSTSASTTHGRPRRMQAEIHNRLDQAPAAARNTAPAADEPVELRTRLARPAEPRLPHPRRAG